MSNNLIHILPDHVANQIAAGEVIQRPSSVLKELLENAVDAGAKSITVVVKDAGKSLIQVIDNGCGMNSEDAKTCFVRHATSKIKSSEDLFALSTKGFRGEAMASIASIAHVELKTQQSSEETGSLLQLEGGKITNEDICSIDQGTQVSVKNIFYNVPARRKFLKSNAVESKHINDEFTRVALIHPNIKFSLVVNDQELYHLQPGNFKQRIVGIFGKNYNDRLVPIEETTEIIKLEGFIVKPEFAKKSRGEQFFFINDRFVKHNYLHHAVNLSFDGLISPNSYPGYFIKIEVDPKELDVNIHPTKTEIKLSEERAAYAILKASIQKSLSQYSLAPSLDFDRETSFDTEISWDQPVKAPEIKVDKDFNPFKEESKPAKESNWSSGKSFSESRPKANPEDWEKLYEGLNNSYQSGTDYSSSDSNSTVNEENGVPTESLNFDQDINSYLQVKGKYILTQNKDGLVLINQKRAHQRVLYEHFINSLKDQNISTQQVLFPETIEVANKDLVVMEEITPQLNDMGFDINPFGKGSYVVNGVPADLEEVNPKQLIEQLIEQLNEDKSDKDLDPKDRLSKKLSYQLAIPYGQSMSNREMAELHDQLFLCQNPLVSPSGKPCILSLDHSVIEKQIG